MYYTLCDVKKVFFVVTFLLNLTFVNAQMIIGNAGLINIPTADMYKEGTFVGGATMMPSCYMVKSKNYNTFVYYIDLTPLKWVELTFRETIFKGAKQTMGDYGKIEYGDVGYYFQDRSYSIRLRPIKEQDGKWWPSMVVGTNDPWSDYGGSDYACVYGVLTKHWNHHWGDLGLSLGYAKPFSDNDGNAQKKSYDGLFGGVSFTPSFWENLRVMVDYDTKGLNFGTKVILFNHWNIFAYVRDFKQAGFGMSYQYTMDF